MVPPSKPEDRPSNPTHNSTVGSHVRLLGRGGVAGEARGAGADVDVSQPRHCDGDATPAAHHVDTNRSLHTVEEPKSKPQLKSPLEILQTENSSALSTSSLDRSNLSSLSFQSKRALTNSWIDALNKRTKYSSPNQNEKSKDRADTSGIHNNKGPTISNLEESYFQRPVAVLTQTGNEVRPMKSDNPSRRMNSVGDRDGTLVEPQSASSNPHSNISNSRKPQSNKGSLGSSDGGDELERALAASREEASKRQRLEAQYNEEIQRAMAESARLQPRAESARLQPESNAVITLDDSDDEEDNRKLPAKSSKGSATAKISGNEDADLNRALRLSLEEAEGAQQQYNDVETIPLTYKKLERDEFQQTVDAFVQMQGGYEKLESGQMIKPGNANDMKKACVVDGGGQNQTGAQYGRYSIHRMWRVFDVLEGKEDTNFEEVRTKDSPPPKLLDGLPGAKIKAFVDIGHGIGIQVLQAGWAQGVPARGVEIMKPRHMVAEAIQDGVLEILCRDPPDRRMADLKLADFSLAVIPDKKTKKRDKDLWRFLLFKDNPEVQDGLVIFINNAEEVFAARSNQKSDGACLDSYLAKLFANMEVGGRMVTLTDVSMHLTQSSPWFRQDSFQSGTDAVSWGTGNKSIKVHVLTKLSNYWFCQNSKCEYKDDTFKDGIAVVTDDGELQESCLCGTHAKRCTRERKPSKRISTEDDSDE